MNKLIIGKDALAEIEQAMFNVPFGNSSFQNNYLINSFETGSRKYRHILLQMQQKLKALKDAEFSHKRNQVKILELEFKIAKAKGFTKTLLEIDLEEKKWGIDFSKKLIEDAIIELNDFYKAFSQLHKYTREEFEAEEKEYWSKRLTKEAQLSISATGRIDVGTQSTLLQIGIDPISAQQELSVVNIDAINKIKEEMLRLSKLNEVNKL
jgi:hypothetical protein